MPLPHIEPMEIRLTRASFSQLVMEESLIVSDLLNWVWESGHEVERDSSLLGQSYMVGEDKVSTTDKLCARIF